MMSTGYECNFIEPEPGRWYYVLQRGDCPVGAWDWREYANCFGPFASYEAADDHLRANHANPGGGTIINHERYRPGDVWDKLIAEARK